MGIKKVGGEWMKTIDNNPGGIGQASTPFKTDGASGIRTVRREKMKPKKSGGCEQKKRAWEKAESDISIAKEGGGAVVVVPKGG